MTCERCKGLMLQDQFVDLGECYDNMWVSSWRCVNCGYTIDPVVAKNRERQRTLASHPAAVMIETLQADSSEAAA